MSTQKIGEESIDVLRERYGYCRTEIMYRLEVRYKIVQFLLVAISISFIAIYKLEWDFFPLIILGLLFAMLILLFGESLHIKILSDYMIKIERIIDSHYEFKLFGWERESR